MAKFEENLKKEQDRTKAALREKLEARRKKKRDAELGKIKQVAKEESRAAEDKEREELTALHKEGAQLLARTAPARPRTPSPAGRRARDQAKGISCTLRVSHAICLCYFRTTLRKSKPDFLFTNTNPRI